MNDFNFRRRTPDMRFGLLLDRPAPDLDWQRCKMKSIGRLQFQCSRASLAQEHEQILAELAARLEAVLAMFKS
jgi:hypothetical protein